MRFIWHEAKRLSNLKKHGLDFADAARLFAGPMLLYEDRRKDYSEQRMIGIGMLATLVVVVVHVESEQTIHIISMRKADRDETNLFYKNISQI